jgi:RNA polymerase sigma factor (sigma-70 family)
MADDPPFALLFAEHYPAARNAARALVPADVADDIAADAFVRVMAAIINGGGPEGDFRPYLLAAVRNRARDHLARSRREIPVARPEPRHAAPAPAEHVVRAEEREMTWRAFSSLPPRHRAVLWQTAVEGRRPAELAALSGMSPNAVARLAARARLGLAVAWQRERGTQERDTGPLPALRQLAARKHVSQVS